MSFHLNNTAGRQLAVWAAIAFATAGCWENSTTKTGRRGYAVTNPDECESYGYAKTKAYNEWAYACSDDGGETKGPVAYVSVYFNCRPPNYPQRSFEHQEIYWARCLNGVQHPSNGNATEYWGLNCILVNGACIIGTLSQFDLGGIDESSAEGILLRAAMQRLLEVRAEVVGDGEYLAERLLLVDAAELITDIAIEAFQEQLREEALSEVSTAMALLDLATDFVPGVSLIKDATIVLTGVNPVTGEEVSDVERAMVAGTLLVPAFVSGGARGFVSVARRLDAVANSTRASADRAADLIGSVRRAEDELLELNPCTGVAFQINANPCDAVGGIVGEIAARAQENLDALKRGEVGFGIAPRLDYAKTYKQHYAYAADDVGQVHHAVEQQVLQRYPGVLSESEVNSLRNLRGIEKGPAGTELHQIILRQEWDDFYETADDAGVVPTKQELLDFAKHLDDLYGSMFIPPIR